MVHPYYLEQFGTLLATEATWCAADQGKFFEFDHALYERQGMPLDQGALVNLAAELGLDQNAIAQCLENGTHRAEIADGRRAAINRGITSTPTFLVNNRRRIDGNQPYEVFKQIIEQELAAAQ